MIYFAHQAYRVIPPCEDKAVIGMHDRMACNHIISKDDILSEKDLPLFMRILKILDFCYFTVFPAVATCAGMYILKSLSNS